MQGSDQYSLITSTYNQSTDLLFLYSGFLSNLFYKQDSEDYTSVIPEEILLIIFSHLTFPDLCSASLVSKKWHNLTEDSSLELKLFREFVKDFVPKTETRENSIGMGIFGYFPSKSTETYSGNFINESDRKTIEIKRSYPGCIFIKDNGEKVQYKEGDFSLISRIKNSSYFFIIDISKYKSTVEGLELVLHNKNLSEREIKIIQEGVERINQIIAKRKSCALWG